MYKFPKIYYQEFLLQLNFIPEFSEISIEWFPFEKFNNFRIFRKLSQEISIPIATISKVPEFLVEQKAPVVLAVIVDTHCTFKYKTAVSLHA